MSMNITGLGLDDVTNLFRLGERTIERLNEQAREAWRYVAFLEAELEAVCPECPTCLQLRRDSGGTRRLPQGKHHSDCPLSDLYNPLPWRCDCGNIAVDLVCESCGDSHP